MSKFELTDWDFCQAAKRLRCTVADIKTVNEVEAAGKPFYPDGFPTILFERHKFYKHAHRDKRDQWHKEFPTICNPSTTPRGGYGDKAMQRVKFAQAMALDPDAAMMACSWGGFQELGENYDDYGFANVGEFVDIMKSGAAGQLEIFCRSILHRKIDDDLRAHDWHGFARNYNGAGYKKWDYHTKLAAAHKKHSKQIVDCKTVEKPDLTADVSNPQTEPLQGGVSNPPTSTDSAVRPLLKIMDDGEAVSELQGLLGIEVTGNFGSPTKKAVIAFQQSHELKPDGVVGPKTWAALEAAQTVNNQVEGPVGITKDTCFTLDTLIWTPEGDIPIGELQVGQRVVSFDPETSVIDYEDEITEVLDHEAGGYYTFEFEHGEINVTPEHRLFRGNNIFVLADMYRIGETVKAFQEQWADSKLKRIRWTSDTKTPVRNLHVRHNRTYFANRCGVHNAKDPFGETIHIPAAEGSSGKEEPPAPPPVEVKAATMTWDQILASVGAFLTSAGISITNGLSNPWTLVIIGIFAIIGYLIYKHGQDQKQARTQMYFANAQNRQTPDITVV